MTLVHADASELLRRFKWRPDLGLLFEPRTGMFVRARNGTAEAILAELYAGRGPIETARAIAARFDVSIDRVMADVDTLIRQILDTEPTYGEDGTRSRIEIDKRFDSLLEFPLRMELELTSVCNWSCGFCYNVWKIDPAMTDHDIRKFVRELDSKHLPLAAAKKILDECAARGAFVVRYSGGETLLHPDAMEIFRYGGELGLYQSVFTNGHFVTPERAQEMADSNVRCALVSLHGSAATQVDLAGHRLAYERSTAAMEHFLAAGIAVVAEMTLVSHNVEEVLDVIRDVYARGVREFSVMRYVPTGKNDAEYGVPMALMFPLMEAIDDLVRSECPGLAVDWPCAQKMCTSSDDLPISKADPTLALRVSQMSGHCESGLVWGSVSYDGRIRNCPHSNMYWGDLAHSSIADTWPTMTAAVHEATRPRPGCTSCTVLEACRGGCHLGSFITNNVSLPMPKVRPRTP
ncbi:hypothetical protein GCM10028801_46020 [Nocardioides maradonensis]